jgi:hypothetical protein
MTNHIIHPNGTYDGRITVIPPRGNYFMFSYTGGVVMLNRVNTTDFSGGRQPIAGLDNESIEDDFLHLPQIQH